MPHLLLGRNNKQLAAPASFRWRVRCWLHGGHAFYYNTELGYMGCYDCQGVWHEEPAVDSRDTQTDNPQP